MQYVVDSQPRLHVAKLARPVGEPGPVMRPGRKRYGDEELLTVCAVLLRVESE